MLERICFIPFCQIDIAEQKVIEGQMRLEVGCFAQGERLLAIDDGLIQVSSQKSVPSEMASGFALFKNITCLLSNLKRLHIMFQRPLPLLPALIDNPDMKVRLG